MLKNILFCVIPTVIIVLVFKFIKKKDSKINHDEPNGGTKTDLSVLIPMLICVVCFFFIISGINEIVNFIFFS